MDDLLGALLGGAESGSDDEQEGQDLLSGLMGGGGSDAAGSLAPLLGSLLGGGQQTGGMTDLLGSLGSGTEASGAGGMTDLLGMLGGSAPLASGGSASGLGSFVVPLAEKLGLPPEIAQVVVSVVLEKLLSGSKSSAPGDDGQALDLAAIGEQMSRAGEIDPEYLDSTGMTQEVVARTGLDADEANASLQQVLAMMTTPGENQTP